MSKRYQVLARKYRPQAFRDVVGQEATVTTLKNAIRLQKVAHAYLFCGSRGVGKTTLARLFAKALNCENLDSEFEPCNRCSSCLEVVAGQSFDVIEIDGASNRGIDDVRKINETVGYAPSRGRFKIYIIDEVHMLTKEAFNALLKTLEEPPEKAKFFFATTEAHKVLPTIISRCQRFDLSKIKPSFIVEKLKQISFDLSRQVEEEALELIASFSEGSLRDAESLLDQIFCFCEEEVSLASVRKALGLAPKEFFDSLDEAFSSSNLAFAFELTEKLFEMGKDLSHFFDQLISHYRNIVLKKCKNEAEQMVYTRSAAIYILDFLIKEESSFQKSIFQRISLEAVLLKIIRSKNRIPVEQIVRHLTDASPLIKGETLPLPKEEAPISKKEPLEEKVSLREVPFQLDLPPPTPEKKEAPPLLDADKVQPKNDFSSIDLPTKPKSHYDTIIRFTAVELEGIVKNNI